MIRPSPRRRSGFTLIELLVVILILAILVALLLPAIMGAIRTARDSQATSEMNNLAAALADFKSQYGDYPPSRLMLSENGFYPTGQTSAAISSWTWFGNPPVTSPGDMSLGQLAQRSYNFLRKLFPRAQFSTVGAIYPNAQGMFHDFNGDGSMGNVSQGGSNPGYILLEGHEALVFFLGGIPDHTSSVTAMTGFAKFPTNPFMNATAQTNRTVPLYQFPTARLIDDDLDGIPGFIDSLDNNNQRYYAYFSSYGSGGYDPNDVNFAELDDNDNPAAGVALGAFKVTFPTFLAYQTNFGSVVYCAASPGPNPYTAGLQLPVNGSGSFDQNVPLTPNWVNNQTFQIICAGRDRKYGIGAQFDNSATSTKLSILYQAVQSVTSQQNSVVSPGAAATMTTTPQRDNLSNFTAARLDY